MIISLLSDLFVTAFWICNPQLTDSSSMVLSSFKYLSRTLHLDFRFLAEQKYVYWFYNNVGFFKNKNASTLRGG